MGESSKICEVFELVMAIIGAIALIGMLITGDILWLIH